MMQSAVHLPQKHGSGNGLIIKTTGIAITTESIELSVRGARSLNESTRVLNIDSGWEIRRETKAKENV